MEISKSYKVSLIGVLLLGHFNVLVHARRAQTSTVNLAATLKPQIVPINLSTRSNFVIPQDPSVENPEISIILDAEIVVYGPRLSTSPAVQTYFDKRVVFHRELCAGNCPHKGATKKIFEAAYEKFKDNPNSILWEQFINAEMAKFTVPRSPGSVPGVSNPGGIPIYAGIVKGDDLAKYSENQYRENSRLELFALANLRQYIRPSSPGTSGFLGGDLELKTFVIVKAVTKRLNNDEISKLVSEKNLAFDEELKRYAEEVCQLRSYNGRDFHPYRLGRLPEASLLIDNLKFTKKLAVKNIELREPGEGEDNYRASVECSALASFVVD